MFRVSSPFLPVGLPNDSFVCDICDDPAPIVWVSSMFRTAYVGRHREVQ